jgi:hypothetical protein
MNWLRRIHQEEDDDDDDENFGDDDENLIMAYNFYNNKLLGLTRDIIQMLHHGGRTRGIMLPVMLRYVWITLGII